MAEKWRARPPQWRVITMIVFLACVWLAMLNFGRGLLDRSLFETLYAGNRPTLITIAHGLTFLGEPTILVAAGFLIGAWLWWQGRGRLAMAVIFVTLLGRGLTEIQKYWIARARPDLQPHLVVVKTSSFPSGHAASSMVFYVTLALALVPPGRSRRVAAACAILLSILIGISRVMLGVHWPSDVVGGWAFGLLWVLLTLRPVERLLRANSS